MRTLTDHIVENDPAKQLYIEAQDEPGSGGACHRYAIYGFDTHSNRSADETSNSETELLVLFQNGPIGEFGVNGVTHEGLLAILIDRLRSFQMGAYACRDNEIALTKLEEALMWLKRRTRERLKRDVEGTARQ